MRIALSVAYNGAAFCGWQRQSHSPSVQQDLETALSKIANHPVSVACAGRTDTGVHGTNQIVHFDTDAVRPDKAWLLGTNTNLNADIKVNWVKPVTQEFHARFSATARRYRYLIQNTRFPPAILSHGLTWEKLPLDADKMHQAAQHFLGEQDFSSVRAANCQSHSKHRNIHHLNVVRLGDFVMIDIQANAFLYHMVRNITGLLLEVGSGRQSPDWVQQVLSAKDRTKAAKTAPANGLYLVDVTYPQQFDLPTNRLGPLFWPD